MTGGNQVRYVLRPNLDEAEEDPGNAGVDDTGRTA